MPVLASSSSSSSSWGSLSSDCVVCSSRIFGQTICSSCFDRRIKQACRNRMGLPGMPRAVCVQPSSSSQPDAPLLPSATSSSSADPPRNEICEQSETRRSAIEDEGLLDFLTKTSNPSEINQGGKKSVKKSVRFSLAEENGENYSTPKSLGSAFHPKTPDLLGVSSGSGSKKKVQFDETALESVADSKRLMQEDSSSKVFMQHKCLRILSSKQGTPVPRSFGHGAELELDPSLRSRLLGSRCGTPKWAGDSNHLQNSHELEDSDPEEDQCLSCMPSARCSQPAASTSHCPQAREMPWSVSANPLWKRRQSCRPITGLQLGTDDSELLEAFDLHI